MLESRDERGDTVCPLYNHKERRRNDRVPLLRGTQQLASLSLDIDSPLFRTACQNLGVLPSECVLV